MGAQAVHVHHLAVGGDQLHPGGMQVQVAAPQGVPLRQQERGWGAGARGGQAALRDVAVAAGCRLHLAAWPAPAPDTPP